MRNNRYYHFLAIFIVGLFVTSCTGIFENGKEMAADAKSRISEVSVSDFNKMLDDEKEFLLIDVRQQKEFDKGNIPGSTLLSRGVLEFKIADDMFWEEEFLYAPKKDDEIIVYCKKGARGILAAESLSKLGYKNVRSIAGGWLAWGSDNPDAVEEPAEEGGCGG
ncbi:hypothetical protein KAH27_05670 [bacterium]|nr:hypothetical protein [bacterium]